MELKVGDLVDFKKYEDMTDEEHFGIKKKFFPNFGKVERIDNNGYFRIEDSGYWFNIGSVYKKITERFILQEDYYQMYVIDSKSLTLDKSKAKVYSSRNEANDEAADMHLNAWEVIPYDD